MLKGSSKWGRTWKKRNYSVLFTSELYSLSASESWLKSHVYFPQMLIFFLLVLRLELFQFWLKTISTKTFVGQPTDPISRPDECQLLQWLWEVLYRMWVLLPGCAQGTCFPALLHQGRSLDELHWIWRLPLSISLAQQPTALLEI